MEAACAIPFRSRSFGPDRRLPRCAARLTRCERVYLAWLVSWTRRSIRRGRGRCCWPGEPLPPGRRPSGCWACCATPPAGRARPWRPSPRAGACRRSGDEPKIPATIVTGFLGAGKTSLIRHLVENAGGRRLALLINEFGDLGVDRAMLGGCGIEGCREEDVIELANGCICCTVADDFLPAMRTILARDPAPDHIVIETSGLALPKPLVAAFNWPEVRSRLTVDGVLVVADAEAVLRRAVRPRSRPRSRPSVPPTPRSTTRTRSRSCSRSSSAAPTWCWSTRRTR